MMVMVFKCAHLPAPGMVLVLGLVLVLRVLLSDGRDDDGGVMVVMMVCCVYVVVVLEFMLCVWVVGEEVFPANAGFSLLRID